MLEENTIEIIDTFKFDFYIPIEEVFLLEKVEMNSQVLKIQSENKPHAGNLITIKKDFQILQAEITSSSSFDENKYEITIDTPSDKEFPIDSKAETGNKNLICDGSAELKTFELNLDGIDKNATLLVDNMIFCIEDVKEVNTSSFGGRNRLKNGLVVRICGKDDYKSLFNVKSNKDLLFNGFKLKFPQNHPNEKYVVIAKQKHSEIVLNQSDRLEIIVQDDLTNMDEIILTVRGKIIKNI